MVMPRRYSSTPLGEPLTTVRLGGLTLTEAIYRPSLKLSKHVHDRALISILLRGSYTEFFGRRPQECGLYSILLKAVGEDHADHYGQAGARCLIIKVEPKKLESMRAFSNIFDHSLHLAHGPTTGLAARLYKEFQIMDSASPLSIEGLVFEILGYAARCGSYNGPSGPPSWLRAAEAMVRDQLSQSIGLMNVAAAVGVHPSHLARMFRKFHGCTMGEYLRRARLERAIQELGRRNQSLAEIALTVGFYDQSHFTRAFKANFGMTPTAFRAAMRKR